MWHAGGVVSTSLPTSHTSTWISSPAVTGGPRGLAHSSLGLSQCAESHLKHADRCSVAGSPTSCQKGFTGGSVQGVFQTATDPNLLLIQTVQQTIWQQTAGLSCYL